MTTADDNLAKGINAGSGDSQRRQTQLSPADPLDGRAPKTRHPLPRDSEFLPTAPVHAFLQQVIALIHSGDSGLCGAAPSGAGKTSATPYEDPVKGVQPARIAKVRARGGKRKDKLGRDDLGVLQHDQSSPHAIAAKESKSPEPLPLSPQPSIHTRPGQDLACATRLRGRNGKHT